MMAVTLDLPSKQLLRGNLPEPTTCVWSAEVLEHIAMHGQEYDLDIDKHA